MSCGPLAHVWTSTGRYHLPKTLEDYYQQIGRAGRDGKKATCVLLHNPKDVGSYSGWTMSQQERSSLEQLREYCGDSTTCRWSR